MSFPTPTLQLLGDQAVILQCADRLEPEVNAQVHRWAACLRSMPGVIEVIPAYASVALWVDSPQRLTRDWLEQLRHTVAQPCPDHTCAAQTPQRLQVDFDAGEDLIEVAARLALTPEALVQRLCAGRYQVAMIGFLPGFPYLLGLDPALALPRRATPRLQVPAGSLALGGAQLGIYPCVSPGGWHVLGRIERALFDPQRTPPALLQPGVAIQLVPA